MEHNFASVVITLLLLGLIVFSFYSLIDQTQLNNGKTTGILTTDSVAVNESLNDYIEVTGTAENALSNSSISATSSGSQNSYIDSVGGIWSNLKAKPSAIYSATIGQVKRSVVSDSKYNIVFNTLSAILVLIFIVSVIRWITTGVGSRT